MHQGVTSTPSQRRSHGAKPTASTASAGFTNGRPCMRVSATCRYVAASASEGSAPSVSALLIGKHQELGLRRGTVGTAPVVRQRRERRARRDLPDRIALGRVVDVPADLALEARVRGNLRALAVVLESTHV